ncbi:MAG TPA: AAA family ATPase, partial [Candidatus Polarisedimenticolaceae bacterium]|nr:AAA family ATPase [Candidatus Polarisedimenticolaceae bacterium]
MLLTLRVRDLVIVDEIAVDFAAGLNLLTGETGAGKSILFEAVGLATGARGDRALVRAGAERAIVEALFEPAPESAAHAWIAEH